MKVGKIAAAIVALTLGGVLITTTNATAQAAPSTAQAAATSTAGPDVGMPYD